MNDLGVEQEISSFLRGRYTAPGEAKSSVQEDQSKSLTGTGRSNYDLLDS